MDKLISILEDYKEEKLENLVEQIKDIKIDDYKKYVDDKKGEKYVKTLIHSTDDIDVFIITWNINNTSGRHSHGSKGCVMMMLEGSVNQCIYNGNVNIYSVLRDGCTYYIDNDIGEHDISNKSNKVAISLHIYQKNLYNK